jgi:microtubule-associated protein 1 light chain
MSESELNITNTNISNVSTIIKKKSLIDFSKSELNQHEKRIIKKEVELIKEKYPTYIPILIKSKNNQIKLTQYKYLVNEEVTISQFMTIIKKKILLKSYEGIYLFINNLIPKGSSSLNSLYKSHKDLETDMLIITVCKENTFGLNME